jgi:four helix bundle protein
VTTTGRPAATDLSVRAQIASGLSFRQLNVWQKSHHFVLGVYRLSATFPPEEKYGLALQLRRAAASVPGNIAEGFKRRSPADKHRLLNIAEASLEEARYYLLLAEDLGIGDASALSAEADEVARLLCRYTARVRESIAQGL